MGWASGSGIFSDVITAAMVHVPQPTRKAFYKDLIGSFEAADWDTQDECLGIDDAYDQALEELHPGWYGQDEADAVPQ